MRHRLAERRSGGAALASVVWLAAASFATPAQGMEVNLNVYPAAYRGLDESLWAPVEDQFAFGATVDFGAAGVPVHFAAGTITSVGIEDWTDSVSNDTIAAISELSFGLAGVWHTKGPTRGYVSGGVSFVWAQFETDTFFGSVDDNDDSLGLWLEAGIAWRMGHHFSLGLHGRMLTNTEIRMLGVDGDADYWQIGPLLAWSWPGR